MNDYITLEEHTTGWPRSGFDKRDTTVKLRRVDPTPLNQKLEPEVQVEIEICEYRDRMYRHLSGLTINQAQFAELRQLFE